jgi:hypothetical protein
MLDPSSNSPLDQAASGLVRKPWSAPEIQDASVSDITNSKSPDFTEATFEKNGS